MEPGDELFHYFEHHSSTGATRQDLRSAVANFFMNYPELAMQFGGGLLGRKRQSTTQYAAHIIRGGIRGDELALWCLSKMLGIHTAVFLKDKTLFTCVPGNELDCSLFLVYTGSLTFLPTELIPEASVGRTSVHIKKIVLERQKVKEIEDDLAELRRSTDELENKRRKEDHQEQEEDEHESEPATTPEESAAEASEYEYPGESDDEGATTEEYDYEPAVKKGEITYEMWLGTQQPTSPVKQHTPPSQRITRSRAKSPVPPMMPTPMQKPPVKKPVKQHAPPVKKPVKQHPPLLCVSHGNRPEQLHLQHRCRHLFLRSE